MSAKETENIILPGEVEELINTMKSIGGGALTEKATQNLKEAVKATVLQGKKSTVTITLAIKKQGDDMITIEGTTKASLPQLPITGGFFFNPRTYVPSRNRQDQLVMNLNK